MADSTTPAVIPTTETTGSMTAEIGATSGPSITSPLLTAETSATWKPTTTLHTGLGESTTAIHVVGADAEDGSFKIILAAVIATVILVLLCLVLFLLRYLYRHKGTYHTNEAKGMEFAESADAALKADPVLQDPADDGNKEYFL